MFTSRDGTLLDSRDDWCAVVPALQRLKQLTIPVGLVTGRAFMEVVAIRRAMANDSAFIVENDRGPSTPDAQRPLAGRPGWNRVILDFPFVISPRHR